MHPAYSVIFFTTASGAGYGLLAWLAVATLAGWLLPHQTFGILTIGLSLAMIGGGLLSSMAHLGHPERAWRAFSQWRSSWLSREGVASVVSFMPALVFAWGWIVEGRADGIFAVAAVLSIVMAIITVFCTAMIYRSLKTVHQWCNAYVVPNYIALSAMTGIIWLTALSHIYGAVGRDMSIAVMVCIIVGYFVRRRYWHFIDTTQSAATPESATGLGHLGTVTHFEGPHTEANYLMKEMGFQVARTHAAKLRRICIMALFLFPAILSVIAASSPGPLGMVAAFAAALSASLGVVVERWLFFAEAKHVVMLYYGAKAA